MTSQTKQFLSYGTREPYESLLVEVENRVATVHHLFLFGTPLQNCVLGEDLRQRVPVLSIEEAKVPSLELFDGFDLD